VNNPFLSNCTLHRNTKINSAEPSGANDIIKEAKKKHTNTTSHLAKAIISIRGSVVKTATTNAWHSKGKTGVWLEESTGAGDLTLSNQSPAHHNLALSAQKNTSKLLLYERGDVAAFVRGHFHLLVLGDYNLESVSCSSCLSDCYF